MKYSFLLFLLLASCSTPLPKPTGQVTWAPGITEQKQERTEWCWAAASRMLLSQKTKDLPKQCEMASKTFGVNCCKENSIKCNQPYYVQDYLKVGYQLPSFDKAVSYIKQGKAVAISRANGDNNTAHYLIAYGTYVENGKTYIISYDPYTGKQAYMDSSYVLGNLKWYHMIVL